MPRSYTQRLEEPEMTPLEIAVSLVAAWLTWAAIRAVTAWLRFRRLANRFPGPRAWPLVGNVLDGGHLNTPYMIICKVLQHLQKHPAVQIWFGPIRVIFLSEPRDIQTFLCNVKHERSPLSTILQSTLGKGLVTLSGDTWRRHNKIIAPAFNAKLLDSFVTTFDMESDILVENLRKHADEEAPFNIEPMIDSIVFNSLCETIMGLQNNQQSKDNVTFFESARVKMTISGERFMKPWLLLDSIFKWSSLGRSTATAVKETKRIRDELIQERKKLLEVDGSGGLQLSKDEWGRKRRLAFLDSLLAARHAGANISDEEIGDEVDSFLLVGQDGTGAFLLLMFYDLARRPEIQDKIVCELRTVLPATDRLEFTPEILKSLTYLEMVIKEEFRLHPSVWLSTIRRAATDVPLPSNGLVIPAGADVLIAMKAVHMKPEYYPEPEVFDPERFSPENVAKRHPYAFVPFGAGQHTCIGRRFAMLEIKTVMAKVLWHYELLPDPSYEMSSTWAMATRPTNGLRLRVRHRTQ